MFLPASQPKGSSEDLSPLAHRDIRLGRMRSSVGPFHFVGSITERPAAPGRRGLLVHQSSAGQIARTAQTTSIRGPALRLQESPEFGFTPPSVPSLRMPGERSLAFASPCAPRVRRWETIPDRLADHTSKYSQVFRLGIRYADTVETRKHRNCRLWIQYLRRVRHRPNPQSSPRRRKITHLEVLDQTICHRYKTEWPPRLSEH